MAREQMPNDDELRLSSPKALAGGAHGDDGTQSLGDQQTFSGGGRPSAPQSLGDELTRGGIGADDAPFDDDTELVDLSARYTVEGKLGQGGMGEVLLATDQRLKRKVAIKRVLGDKVHSRTALQRFLTEAQSVAALNHPNIVQIYDYGRDQVGPFLILEYVDGSSLLDRCREGALPLADAVKLTCQLCDGLEMAHAAKIIHRDIKPANVLLTKSGMPKLTDFGLAKDEAADSSHTQTGAVLGTLDFMPPEQRKDAALTDARSDLWSLAATLYQLVTGKTPKIIRLNTLPASLQGVLSQALEDNPDERFQTAAEFREALQACLKESDSRSVSDPSAAVDLEEGTCLACGTKNDLNRKFCRKCAASLRVSCLSCEAEIPNWDNICAECGANQQQRATSRRSELDAQRAEAESLRSQYQFRKALKLAREISLVTDLRLQHLKGWAESFLSATETEQKRQEENAISHFAEAQSHRTAFDYPAAIHAMQSIPEVMRTSGMQSYLQTLQSEHHEVTELIEAISDRVKRRDLDGLLEPVSRAVELRGDRADLRKLLTQLTERQEKLIRQRDEAYHQSKLLLDQGRAKEALTLIQTVKTAELRPNDLELNRRLQEIVKSEEELAALVKASKADNVLEPEEVVAMFAGAEKCLRGNPSHEKIRALRENMIQRILKTPDAYSGLPNSVLMILSPSILAKLPIKSRSLEGHTSAVTSVAFSPDGKRLASASQDQTVKVWDAATGQVSLTLKGHTGEVWSVAFSPDGQRLASASFDRTVKVWDAATGQESRTLKGHTDWVRSVAFSPDGKRLASASSDETVKVWYAATGQESLTLKGHTDSVRSVAFSPDGKRLASASFDRTVKVWDAATGQESRTLKGHTDWVRSVAFSPDGKRLASASWDHTVKVWDAATGQESLTLKGHTSAVYSVAFSPDGKRLASASEDGTVKLWDAATGQESLTLKGHTSAVYSVAFSPDGQRLASASQDQTVKVWESPIFGGRWVRDETGSVT